MGLETGSLCSAGCPWTLLQPRLALNLHWFSCQYKYTPFLNSTFNVIVLYMWEELQGEPWGPPDLPQVAQSIPQLGASFIHMMPSRAPELMKITLSAISFLNMIHCATCFQPLLILRTTVSLIGKVKVEAMLCLCLIGLWAIAWCCVHLSILAACGN